MRQNWLIFRVIAHLILKFLPERSKLFLALSCATVIPSHRVICSHFSRFFPIILRAMLQIGAALLAGIIATTAYLYSYVLSKRRELDGLPCPPMKSRLFGHLDIAGECDKLFPRNCHKHLWIRYMQKRWGMGDYFYIDWWPLGPRWLFIADPELSNQFVTVQQSLPKSSLEVDYIVKFLGESNMITVEGQKWKYLRSIFNPGFSAGHLMTLTGYIVDASATFYKLIREKAETGELFELEEYAMKLTIDIIGKVVLDSDFESQTRSHPIVEAFRERAYLLPVTGVLLDFSSLELIRRFKTWRNGIKLDRLIGEELDRKMAAHAAQDNRPTSFKGRKRSVVDLALDAYMKERSSNGASTNGSAKNMNGSAKLPAMDATFRQDAIDSMKSFIFAGHDTTASTIAYLFYMLHFHPDVHKKVVAELDAVFSPGATSEEIGNAIKENPHIINTLEYTTAVLKETLRLFPPGSTLRYTPPSKGHSKTQHLIDPKTGQKLPIEGFHICKSSTQASQYTALR